MDFSQFSPFEDRFCNKYCGIINEFPFAYLLIEKQLRNFEGGFPDLAVRNARNASKTNYGRMLRAVLFAWRYKKIAHSQYYMSFERFSKLEAGLKPMLSTMGISPFTANKQLNRLATLGTAYSRFMKVASRRGFEHAANDRALLRALDRQGQKNFERIKRFLTKANIKLFLADGDTTPHTRLYCLAARQLQVPYIVFAHGYVQDLQLVSVAPINADYFIPWTEQQLRDLAAAVKESDAQKLRYFGYPKAVFPSAGVAELALIAWHSLFDCDRAKEIEAIKSLTRRAQAEGYNVRLRLHPKDRSDNILRETFSNMNVDVSTNALDVDILDSEIVLGSYSSVMIEAAMSGNKVLQVSDYSIFSFENVPLLGPDDSIRKVIASTSSRTLPKSFDFEEFGTFLSEAMK